MVGELGREQQKVVPDQLVTMVTHAYQQLSIITT